MAFNMNSDEKEISMMVKKVVHEVMKEIDFDLENILDSDLEDLEMLVLEKTLYLFAKDPRHMDSLTTFGNEELEKLEMN
jgi:hypothetical protein